jgi:hypothetical protein
MGPLYCQQLEVTAIAIRSQFADMLGEKRASVSPLTTISTVPIPMIKIASKLDQLRDRLTRHKNRFLSNGRQRGKIIGSYSAEQISIPD